MHEKPTRNILTISVSFKIIEKQELSANTVTFISRRITPYSNAEENHCADWNLLFYFLFRPTDASWQSPVLFQVVAIPFAPIYLFILLSMGITKRKTFFNKW